MHWRVGIMTQQSNVETSQQTSTPVPVDEKWLSHELLPGRYVESRRARRVLVNWSVVVLLVFAALCGVTTSFWLRGNSIRQRHAEVAAAAQPLDQLRQRVFEIERRSKEADAWNVAVGSAKPDDSVLQALAAITNATVEDDSIDVEMVDVKMAIEFTGDRDETPKWAQQRLEVTARVPDRQKANAWAKRINRSDRIDGASVRTSISPDDNLLQITGKPQSARALP